MIIELVKQVNGKKAFVLKFNEARNMKWMDKVYLAEYDEKENTIIKLKPFEGDQHFYEEELAQIENALEKNAIKHLEKTPTLKE